MGHGGWLLQTVSLVRPRQYLHESECDMVDIFQEQATLLSRASVRVKILYPDEISCHTTLKSESTPDSCCGLLE